MTSFDLMKNQKRDSLFCMTADIIQTNRSINCPVPSQKDRDWNQKFAMYPKVKAVVEVGSCKQRGSCLNSNYLQSHPPSGNNQEDDLQIYVAKIPKIYIPSVLMSENKSTETNKRNKGADIEPKIQKTKSSPILRPRAVVSSPDNDAMIGSINRSEERKAKRGLKSGHERKNFDTNVKISSRTVAKQSGVNTKDHK